MAFVAVSAGAGALLGGAAIGAGTLASGIFGASAAGKAADAQSRAAANALALQRDMFNQSQQNYTSAKENFDPYLGIGRGATYSLGSLYGIGPNGEKTGANPDFSQFYNSPDYAFAQQQGELGLTRAENARGLNLSGGALKDIAQFNQGLATQQYGNYFNRLMGLSQIGQTAAQGVGNLTTGQANNAANFSGQMSNSIQGQGQAQAAGIVGGANAITGGINSGISNTLLYNAINRSSYSPPGQSAITQPLSINPGNTGGPSGSLGPIY